MKNETKKGLVPKLRFPEFREDPEWNLRKLSDILKEHGAKSKGNEEVFSVSVHKGVINQIEHLGRSFSAATTDHYKRVFPGDIIYTKSPTGDFPYGIIKQSKVDSPIIVSPLYGVFTPETSSLGYILDSHFESPANAINYLSSLIQKGAKNTINISNERFLSKALYLPENKKEQQKIADCLSTLDELIAAHTKKLNALKCYKIGLMQQLFPADGEKEPNLRFHEFVGSGEWKMEPLGNICNYQNGTSHEDGVAEKGVYYLISLNSIDIEGNLKSTMKRLPYTDSSLQKDDMVMVLSDVAHGNFLGLTDIIPNDKFVLNQRMACLRLRNTSLADVRFLRTYINKNQKYFKNKGQGSAQLNLPKSTVTDFPLLLPEPKEQQKIAECISFLNEATKAQTEKVEALKTHKKGLMQGLFPIKYEN